jgi:hypothetical protein
MMRYFGIYALLALVMCALNATQAQAQQVATPANSAFFGLCEKVSFTNAGGAEGLKTATKLDKSIQYIASGDYDELTLIPSSGTFTDAIKYKGQNNSQIFPEGFGNWTFTNGVESISIIFMQDGRRIFHTEQNGSKATTYYWGACNLGPSPQAEKTDSGTVYTQVNRSSQNGKLNTCGIEYGSYIRDHAYGKGQKYYITGSINFQKNGNGDVGSSLKVITTKATPLGNFIGQPEKVTNAYLMSGKLNNLKDFVANFNSDTPGALFVVFRNSDAVKSVFKNTVKTNKISVMFSRSTEGLDVEVPLDLTIGSEGEANAKTMTEFSSCVNDLAGKQIM